MKAVFLDAATFSRDANLPKPPSICKYTVYDTTDNDSELIISRCVDTDIIITNKVQLTADIIQRLPKLKLIQLTATGMNNVDINAAKACGVKVYNVAGYSTNSVPEHTLMMMLSVMRAAGHYHKNACDGTWQADGKFCLLDEPIFDLAGKTLGIIGVGHIGKKVAQLAKAFGMCVLYAEHQGKTPRNGDYTGFDDVLNQSDVISLHCLLNDDTYHLINQQTISQMSKKPLIINVARGGIVNSQDIVDALNNEQIFGYAADVFEQEPFVNQDPLLKIANHPRVLFTPHNAWGSLNAQHRLWEILTQQVERFILQHP